MPITTKSKCYRFVKLLQVWFTLARVSEAKGLSTGSEGRNKYPKQSNKHEKRELDPKLVGKLID